MKSLLLPLLLLSSVFLGRASAADVVGQSQPLTPEQIEELVSPIALYPDPLVALILPASTFPSDIVLAARFLDRGGSPETAGTEPWDESVKSLARYGEVIDYLDDHLEWTRRLGHCFMDQPDAVMDAIQMVRIRAKAAGLLADTPEQHIIVEEDEICIVPAQPTIIYVPRYDPWIICGPSIPVYSRGPFITFGLGFTVGSWLNFDCDWRARSLRIVSRPAYWYHSPRWDDRNRYRQFAATPWSRRTPYPRHDGRFDRSRVADYQIPGRDRRDWSERDRVDTRPRTDHRPDSGRHSTGAQNDRSRDWQNRRRSETNDRSRDALNPAGSPVIPPVATPMPEAPRPVQSYRRPDTRTPAGPERFSPDRTRNDNRTPPPARVAPERPAPAPAPNTMNRTRPPERAQPTPARRADPPDRSDQRSDRNSDDRSSSRRSGGRDSGRGVDQLR